MSDLQLALLAVAVLLLLALYLSGRWQERRVLRRLRERLHGGVRDALLQGAGSGEAAGPGATPAWARGARRDPIFSGDPGARAPAAGRSMATGAAAADQAADEASDQAGFAASAASSVASSAASSVASYVAVSTAAEDGAAPRTAGETASIVTSEALRTPVALLQPDWADDPLLDCTLEIRCARAVDGVSVIDAAAILAHASWRLPVHFVVWDGRHLQWVLPDRFGYYNVALASIQLADRRARIEQAELERFVQTARQVASALDADVDAPDLPQLLVQAQELDSLCARYDVKIGLTVLSSGGPWTGPQLRNCAQQAGFSATSATRWLRRDEQGEALYSLQADAADMGQLALELDVALSPVESRAFRSMVDSAFALAAALGGRVVDDNGAPIEPRSMDTIEAQLLRVYGEMRAAGIEPGSARARRLYV